MRSRLTPSPPVREALLGDLLSTLIDYRGRTPKKSDSGPPPRGGTEDYRARALVTAGDALRDARCGGAPALTAR